MYSSAHGGQVLGYLVSTLPKWLGNLQSRGSKENGKNLRVVIFKNQSRLHLGKNVVRWLYTCFIVW